MPTKILFFLNIIIVFLLSCTFLQAAELKIVPLKKPILSDELIEKKITQNIIKPQKKPKKKDIKDKKIAVVEEEKSELGIILPKNKPLVVKKKISKVQKKSKYYRKKDFSLAKKAINAMEKKKMG